MARSQGMKIENNFSLGLVTETTELGYPRNSCVDVDNCIIDQNGTISRRPPLDIETSTAVATDLGYSLTAGQIGKPVVEYVWTSVGGDGDTSFLVLQYGNLVYFFDVSDSSTDTMTNRKGFTIDLESYVVSGSTLVAADYPCSFSNGRGKLIITNKAIDPLKVTYDPDIDGITIETITVKFRDFAGVPSSIDITTRPTTTVAAYSTTNPQHIYNLYNQGWLNTDALSQWDTARADLPSLCDTVGTFRASETDAFDNTKVGPKNNGNTRAPSGHFILSIGLEERSSLAGVDVGGGSSSIGFAESLVSQVTTPSGFSGSTSTSAAVANLANANDANPATFAQLTTTVNDSPVPSIVGSSTQIWQLAKTFSTPTKIFSVVVRSPTASTYASTTGTGISGCTFTTGVINVYGVSGALTSALGTLIGSVPFNNTISEINIVSSSDSITEWDHIQIEIRAGRTSYTQSAAAVTFAIRPSSIDIYAATNSVASTTRPEITAFFAGRAWYAAPGYDEKGTLIYFSQIIEREDQYGSCYQVNDPTSEYFFDLLASDGGTVSIPEIANVLGLFPMRSALVVLATNGIWIIRGSSSEGFSATSYRVEKVTSVGCVSRYSIADVKGLPYWMGEDGIYTLEYDPNFNAFQLKSLSDERVRTYIKDNIPATRKRFTKIQYDTTEQIVRILFNTDSSIVEDEFYYNRMLNFDLNSKAWYPWLFDLDTGGPIQGMINVFDANHVYPALLKIIFISDGLDAATKIYFADFKRTSTLHRDWDSFVDDYSGNTATKYAFSSYVVTAPAIDAEALKFFQSNYVMVFLNTVANSSCKVQGLFDWTSSGNSGKWSTAQEAYLAIANSRVGYRRLKIRGKGRSLSLKFASTGTGPFEVIGWAILETANQGV